MTLSFICAHHKEWLYFHSEEGIDFIEDAHRKGQYLIERSKWKKAIPFLGAAFDATEIMVDIYGNNKDWLLAELSLVTLQLMESLTKLGINDHANIVSQRALSILTSALKDRSSNVEDKNFVQACILEIKSASYSSTNGLSSQCTQQRCNENAKTDSNTNTASKIGMSPTSLMHKIMMRNDLDLFTKQLAH